MTDDSRRLTLRVDEQNADDQAIEELTLGLRSELRALDAEAERAGGGEAPPGTRALELVALGTLIVTLAQSDVLAAVINAVSTWASRNLHRSVRIELDGDVLEVSGHGKAEQQRLTDEWLARRSAAKPRSTSATRHALIVAGYEFQDPGLRRLRAPAHDAQALSDVLSNPGIGDFQVRTLLNEPAPVVNEAIEEFFADRKPDDLLLLHFSGHGVKDEEGELYFATAATKLNRLGATAVSADFVNRRMSRSRSRRIVLLLDCCYAGAFGRGMVPRAGKQMDIQGHFGGRGRAVITASNASEYAFEGADLADSDPTPSVFTSALVEGLRTGDADMDSDGFVGLDELYEYVYDRVRRETPNQTPGKWTFDLQGDLQIARRGRPVSKPSALPEEIQAAVDHPLAGVRAGAVTDLARMLDARHHGMALAARLALQRLSEDDSRDVSARAAGALAAALPDPVPVAVAAPIAMTIPAVVEPVAVPTVPAPEPTPERSPEPEPEPVAAVARPAAPKVEPVAPRKPDPVAPQQRTAEAAKPAEAVPAPDALPERARGWRRLGVAGLLAWVAAVSLAFVIASQFGLLPRTLPTRFFSAPFGYSLFFTTLLAAAVAVLVTAPSGRTRVIAVGAAFGLASGLLGMLYVEGLLRVHLWNLPYLATAGAGLAVLIAVLTDPLQNEESRPIRIVGPAAIALAAGLTIYCLIPQESRADVPAPDGIGVFGVVLLLGVLYLGVAAVRAWSRGTTVLVAILGATASVVVFAADIAVDKEGGPALAAYALVTVALLAAMIIVPERERGLVLALRLGAIIGLLAVNRVVSNGLPSYDHGIADLILIGAAALAIGTFVLASRAAGKKVAG